MNKTLTVLSAALALAFPAAYAEDAHHPDKQQDKPAAAAKAPAKAAQAKPKVPKATPAVDAGMDCPMHKDGMGMMGMMGKGGMMSHGGDGDHEAMMARMHQMEKRMDMMQMMMEKMMKSGGEAMPGMGKP